MRKTSGFEKRVVVVSDSQISTDILRLDSR
jgi:hypothetical protein